MNRLSPLSVDRADAIKRVKHMAVMYRDKHIPGIARRRMGDAMKAQLRVTWTKEMDALIFALRAMGDFEL